MSFALILFAALSALNSTIPAGESIQNKSTNFVTQLDHFIQASRDEFGIESGMSVAIVRNGESLFLQSYGLRDVENSLPLENQTPVYIASATKSFIGILAKILESEGILDLGESIETYLPESNIKGASEISIKDLLSHQSGMKNNYVSIRMMTGQQDFNTLLSLFEKYSRASAHEYDYDNIGYILTGLIIEKVTGKSWQEHLKTKIFEPLGMVNTSTYVSYFDVSKVAKAHLTDASGTRTLNYFKTDKTMTAAGGMLSSGQDMANWLSMITNRGVYKGDQFLSPQDLADLFVPQVYYGSDKALGLYDDYAYGLGWFISNREEKQLNNHEGGFHGFRTSVTLWEGNTIGIVVMANEGSLFSSRLNRLIADYAYDLISGQNEDDRTRRSEFQKEEIAKRVDRARLKESPVLNNSITYKYKVGRNTGKIDIDEFTGDYSSDRLGEVNVRKEGDELLFSLGVLSSRVPLEAAKTGHFLLDFEVMTGEVKFVYSGSKVSSMKLYLPDHFDWKFKKTVGK